MAGVEILKNYYQSKGAMPNNAFRAVSVQRLRITPSHNTPRSHQYSMRVINEELLCVHRRTLPTCKRAIEHRPRIRPASFKNALLYTYSSV